MAPKRKRNQQQQQHIQEDISSSGKKLSKAEIVRKICKRKLDSLDEQELRIKHDRLTTEEKLRLIDAYNEHGFNIFQNPAKLLEYLPNRPESDIKGLLQRLEGSLQPNDESDTNKETINNEKWQKLCDKMMGNFSKDKKINMDQIFADVLKLEADEMIKNQAHKQDAGTQPNYGQLLKSFSQLIMGTFPDKTDKLNAQLSIHLFEHVNEVAESICSQTNFESLKSGSWLEDITEERKKRHEMALKGLESIDGVIKKCPTFKDLDTNPNIEALCLELPKIRRVTEVLNPLQIDDLNRKYSEIILGSSKIE